MMPLNKRLPKDTLLHLFTEMEMTDKAIGKLFAADRSAITHLRKDYGIPTRQTTGRQGELFVLEKLQALGLDAQDLYKQDKLAPFDILVDGHLRIDVKTSRANQKDGYYRFALSDKIDNGNKVSEHRIKLPGGRTRKLYRETCDILILVCWDSQTAYVIPSGDIPDTQGNIGLMDQSKRYRKYKENWGLLQSIDIRKAAQQA